MCLGSLQVIGPSTWLYLSFRMGEGGTNVLLRGTKSTACVLQAVQDEKESALL